MKAEIRPCNHAHGRERLAAFREGFVRHGGTPVERGGDLVVMWGHRDRGVIEGARPYLVMETGYVGDRLAWSSLGFNGLNGRARFAKADDAGARWDLHFGRLMQPWRCPTADDVAVVMGQVRGDASLRGVDIAAWYAEAAANLKAEWGLPVVFRPHPLDPEMPAPAGCAIDRGPLAALLARTRVAAVFNSNSGVDAVLAGVPVIAADAGAMCRPVAARDWDHLHTPDRAAWAANLAFAQWTAAEIRSGAAWEKLRGIAWAR